jgi:serine/threonine-protein kinase
LADRIARGAVPPDEALPIAKQIAEALEAAHQQGIIHRDLKPANIKVRADDVVKVLDFGLAKLNEPIVPNASTGPSALSLSPTITSPAMMTGVGMLLGTAAYMSPEQARGNVADKRSDMWAFGCVLFEMLTGKSPFGGNSVADTLANVLKAQPEWGALPSDVAPSTHRLLERCLEKDPNVRVSDMAVARYVLAEASQRHGVGTNPSHAPAISRRLMTALLVLVGAVSVGLGSLISIRSNSSPAIHLDITLPKGTVMQTAQGAISVSLDGTRLVYATDTGLFLRDLRRFDVQQLLQTSDARERFLSPAFSPDGKAIAFYALEGAIKRVAVSGGPAVTICRIAYPYGMSWDNAGILVGQGPDGIRRCDATGGEPQQIIQVGVGELADTPQMLPDGEHVLFTLARAAEGRTRWDTARVVVQSLRSGERTTLIDAGSSVRYMRGRLFYAVGGVIFAVPFDASRLITRGTPVPVIQGVARSTGAVTGVAHVALSETGTVYYRPGAADAHSLRMSVAIADREGTVSRLLPQSGPFAQVRVSRDGKRLAIMEDDGKDASISVYRFGSSAAVQRLTIGGHNRFAVWSPDGERIAFQSDRDGAPSVFMQRVDGTTPPERLSSASSGEAHVPESWSPDGRTLLVSIAKHGINSLAALSVDNRTFTRLNVDSVQPIGSVFSPDGRWIAYAVTSQGGATPASDRGVYVQPYPPTGAIYRAPTVALDFHPAWASNGSELLYLPSNLSGQLARVSVSASTAITFGTPVLTRATVTGDRTSTDPRAWDVLPDGRFVGLVDATDGDKNDADDTNEVRVMINWFAELDQLTATN